MAQTLLEISKLLNSDIIAGVSEQVIKVNPIFEFIPVYQHSGRSITINQHTTGANAAFYAEGAIIAPAVAETFVEKTYVDRSLIVDADVSKLSIAVGSEVNALAVEIQAKAKDLGQVLESEIINGAGAAPSINSMFSETTLTVAPIDAVLGDALSFTKLDQIKDLCKAKNGRVDFMLMSYATLNKLKSLLRGLGGNAINNLQTELGNNVLVYDGTPVFVSDYKLATETIDGLALTGGTWDSVYAGTFDSGNLNDGLSLVTPQASPTGITIEEVGTVQNADVLRARVKWYGNLALGNTNGLVRAYGIDPTL